jgi:hypothetical protein
MTSALVSLAPGILGGGPATPPGLGPPPPPPPPSIDLLGPHMLTPYDWSPIPQLPLQIGDLVVTMYPDIVSECGSPADSYCVKIVRGAADGPPGVNHLATFFSNELAANPLDVWDLANLGPVFGCCLDEEVPPNIYVAASTVYGAWPWGPGGSGAVYKLDGATGAISVFVTLPNPRGSGLGDVCYDRVHRQWFVSNFEDGKIYRIKYVLGTPTVVQGYDPWAQDDDAPDPLNPAILGERVWAVHVPDSHWWEGQGLFFSAWLRDEGRPAEPWPAAWPALSGGTTPNNTIFRVQMNASGAITANPPAITVVMPTLPAHAGNTPPHPASSLHSNPVSDIVSSGRVLILAEHRMGADTGVLGIGHLARVLRYLFAPALPYGQPLFVGDLAYLGSDGANSAGGVAIDVDNRENPTPFGANIWATGDALHYGTDDLIYGLQLLPAGGNGSFSPYSANSNLVDMDHNLLCYDKEQIGDVERYAGPAARTYDPNEPHRFWPG